MKNLHKLLLLAALAICLAGCKKENSPAPQIVDSTVYTKAPADFRVLGYMYIDDAESAAGKNFDFTRINYLNIAFINPDASGNFASLSALATTIGTAHSKGVKVMASLAGSGAPGYWSTLLG